MNIFDVIGPVMVGPSSSHTAGAARIGLIAKAILGGIPNKARILFHGSFAETYRGHGSDKAVIGGLLGYSPDDSAIKDSLKEANTLGMDFSFHKAELTNAHPNTIVIEASNKEGKTVSLQGASVGGGNVVVQRLNGVIVDFTGNYDTLIVENKDISGAIANVTNYLAAIHVNIANMKVFRSAKGGNAIMVIEADGRLARHIADTISEFDSIAESTYIAKI